MDEATKQKLTRLPLIGGLLARLLSSRPWHVYEHLEDRHWARLAAAITFNSFLALFPVLALGVAIGSAFLTQSQMTDIEGWFADQVPGISDSLDLQSLFDNAGTIGLVALILLLPTGVSWVSELRGCLRAVWDLPDPEENPVLRKVKDLGVLAGLGLVMLLSLATSAVALTVVRQIARGAGVSGGPGTLLLQLIAHLVALGVTGVLIFYVLVWLPGVRPPRRAVVVACLMGAIGFELLKALLSGYLTEVAAKSVYGAFGVPIALLVWINLMAKLLLYCCAWTATAVSPAGRAAADALESGGADASPPADGSGAAVPNASALPPRAAEGGGGPDIPRPPAGPDRAR